MGMFTSWFMVYKGLSDEAISELKPTSGQSLMRRKRQDSQMRNRPKFHYTISRPAGHVSSWRLLPFDRRIMNENAYLSSGIFFCRISGYYMFGFNAKATENKNIMSDLRKMTRFYLRLSGQTGQLLTLR